MTATPETRAWIDAHYPRGPKVVPGDLTQPSLTYRLRVWLALAGLGLFFGLYIAGGMWFAWVAYHLLFQVALREAGGFWPIAVGISAGVLSAFMWKALLSLRTHREPVGTKITEADQPRLFAFLYRLADEVGAPRPRRVYVSSRVNAAVMYDLSILNLLLPLRRDLEIGLGLVNVLTLTEFKAVLAHEFGHFTQHSMLVGRWVYVGGQIATSLVVKRDALDALLSRFSGTFFLNPIWLFVVAIAWMLRLTIWSIRMLTDASFRLLVLSQRALSRQMEFHADLVAVSVTGSDPLVDALHKLQGADAAWTSASAFASAELRRGSRIPDLFALQSIGIERLQKVLGMPDFGCSLPVPDSERSAHRVFKARFAQPPQMWSTHPPSYEREANCKRRYVDSDRDDVRAWVLFEQADALREQLTIASLKSDKATAASKEESLLAFARTYERPSLDRSYQGAYLWRPVARIANEVSELYGSTPSDAQLAEELASLYPESLGADVERLRSLTEERDGLSAILDGTQSPPDGVIRFRGDMLKRRQLPATVEGVRAELDAVAARITEHDKRCRTVHRAAASAIRNDWDAYLAGLLALLHYAEHSEANLLAARTHLAYVLARVTHHGRIRSHSIPLVVTAAQTLFTMVCEIFDQAQQVSIDPVLARRLGAPDWTLRRVRLQAPVPVRENLGVWIQSFEQWYWLCANCLGQLRRAALDELLATEALVAEAYRKRAAPEAAPPPSAAPRNFPRWRAGGEHPQKLRPDWLTRWQLTPGPLAAVSRLVAAACLLFAVSLVGLALGGHGDAQEQFKLGLAAASAAKQPEDFARVAEWYGRAAKQGYAPAQNNLGILYEQGRGVPQDLVRAVALFREAALQNERQAQANLGFAYLEGRGVARDEPQGVSWLMKAAEQGVAAAQLGVGVAYLKGTGVDKNASSAAQWLRKAANQGNAAAEADLGLLYSGGNGVKKDAAEAASWYQKAASQGEVNSQVNLGLAYVTGVGVPKDTQQAVNWFRKAAAQGNAVAQTNLGSMYSKGDGVVQDLAEAASWYRKAADQGNAIAQVQLGTMYYRGAGVPRDAVTGIGWFRKAAEQGNAVAQANLGVAYANGDGIVKDLAQAASWYQKAADQGDAAAQASLGVMYYNGIGVPKDALVAVRWFREAAEQGNAAAQTSLGIAYSAGSGVALDLKVAVDWLRKGADQGHAPAQYNLGVCYLRGNGVEADRDKAIDWFKRAAAQGFEPARNALATLQGSTTTGRRT